MNYKPNKTQEDIILDILREAKGNWVDGMTFLNLPKPITQYHARIWSLQRKGYEIEGRFIYTKNWKEYRLIAEPQKLPPASIPKPQEEPISQASLPSI